MGKADELLDAIEKIEKMIRFHGLWGNPYIPPPQIPIRGDMPEESQKAAQVLNRIFFVRSLDVTQRLFGPVRESAIEAFQHDYTTVNERVNYARNQLNILIADLPLVKGLDTTGFERISE